MMMRAADIDVRPPPASGRRGAGGTRLSLLARLLLAFVERVPPLDRKLVVLVVAVPISACVIPVGPEFQDPPGAPNSPPSIESTDPLQGTIITVATPHFTVIAADNDVGDELTVKWIADYPPWIMYSKAVATTIPADGRRVRPPTTFDLGCEGVTRGVNTTHSFSVAISDRGFPGRVNTPDDTTPAIATWTWIQNCP